MPRYYFDISDHVAVQDEIGIELADLNAAKDMATRTICEVALDVLPRNGPELTLAVAVRDEGGNHVMNVMLSFSITRHISTNQNRLG